MKFSGLQKISLIDYPDKIASVLFTPGCNLRCGFCHNWRIILDPKPPFLQEATALELLKSRKKYVDSVVITGGEPCMHKELPNFLAKLKSNGFKIKLDTNGFYPDTLKESLDYVDYVALDLKTIPEKYVNFGAKKTGDLMVSIQILKNCNISYEFRTTMVPEIVELDEAACLGEIVKGASTVVLQQFNPKDTLDKQFEKIRPFSPDAIQTFADTLQRYTQNVVLRL